MTKKTIMREFTIAEISAVDIPAQEGARALIMKRAGEPGGDDKDLAKHFMVMTDPVDGHQHLIDVRESSGSTSYAHGQEAESIGHDHPYLIDEFGIVTIGENGGHSHKVEQKDVNAIAQRITFGLRGNLNDEFKRAPTEPEPLKKDNNMTEQEFDKAVKDANDKAEAAEAKLAKAEALNALPADQRSHLDTLDEGARDEFMAKSADDRADDLAQIAADADANSETVFKSANGTIYTKSDDPRLVEMAKGRDEDNAKIAKRDEALAKADLEKRATDTLGHLPGEMDTKVALLKAVDGIKDEDVRKAAGEILVAKNEAHKGAFVEAGTTGGIAASDTSADTRLDVLAKAHVAEKGGTIEAAHAYITTETEEGRDLYSQSIAV